MTRNSCSEALQTEIADKKKLTFQTDSVKLDWLIKNSLFWLFTD